MEAQSPVLLLVLNILTGVFFLALLFIIGGIGDNIKKVRKMLEEELKMRHSG